LEWWNTGRLVFKRISAILNNILDTNFIINSKLRYPSTRYSIIPTFHHSNWGEAPDLSNILENIKGSRYESAAFKGLRNDIQPSPYVQRMDVLFSAF